MKNFELKKESLNALSNKIHKWAIEKGFYEKEINVPEKLMLIVSELGEALEAHRINKRAHLSVYDKRNIEDNDINYDSVFCNLIKDTLEDELADAIIRILDLCDALSIDIDFHVAAKHHYNLNRPYKHNKEY